MANPLPSSSPTRPVIDSATVQGLALAAAPIVASWMGVDPSQVVAGADSAVQLAGLAYAAYGRVRIGDLHWPWSR